MSLRPIKRLVRAQPTLEGAGVHLRRAFGFGNTSDFDPFLLLDDFRNDVPKDYLAGFPWHPHRGIETITYVLAGTVEHADSLGNSGAIAAGDVQWMTAGSGIIHQEMPHGDVAGRMHGFQLWANLPRFAQDDGAPLPGGAVGRHPPSSPTTTGPTSVSFAEVSGESPGPRTGSRLTPSISISRFRPVKGKPYRSRRLAMPSRTSSQGQGNSATHRTRRRCGPREALRQRRLPLRR